MQKVCAAQRVLLLSNLRSWKHRLATGSWLGRWASSSASSAVPYESYKADETTLAQDAPESADAVIMGGGVIGCSTLYHLSKMGVSNVVLLEKDQLTAGTTWHTAGLVWGLRPSDLEVELLKTSKALMQRLESETGIHSGWINNGGLFIASTKERLDEYKRLMTLGKVFGVDSHVLSPDDTQALYPLMNVKDIYGTLYVPSDGTIDPAGYCSAMARGAQHQGAKVLQNCPVTGIQVQEDDYGTKRVKAVETPRGTIQTKVVVNCGGVWAPQLGAMVGIDVPLVAMHHAYVVTERIEGIQNMPNTRDHDASVYLKLQGDALCIGGYEPNPIFCKEVQPDFAFSLYDLDWDVFSSNIEGCMNRIPAIEQTGIKSTVCGPESFTADHKPLMGESPEVRGYYFGCGFNSSGMMLSGGCGEQLAQWIVDGCPEHDMFSYDIRRFPTQLTGKQSWVKERSHEAYAKNYAIVFKHDEPLASRNMRKDALYDVLRDAGCVFQERQGWERPGWFSKEGPSPVLPYDYYGAYELEQHPDNHYFDRLKLDYTFDFPKQHDTIKSQCMGCRQRVALFNMSYFGKFYITGPDAQKATDWIFSNNMDKPPGSTVYSCMLNKRGGVEADLTVSMLEPGSGEPHQPSFQGDGFYVAVGGGLGQHAYSHMLDILQDNKFDCKITDHSEDLVMMSLQGPKSREVLQTLTDADLSNEGFPFSTNKVIEVAGHSARAMRLTFVGELGWELHLPNHSAVPVYKALMKAGGQHGIINAGYRAIDSLSIEKGYRHWHEDLRGDDTPLEAGLAFTCKLKSATPFLGREALEEKKSKGLRKRMMCFTIDEHVALHGLEAIWRDDQVVGFIRRADYAFSLDKSIAYGYITHPQGEVVSKDYLMSGSYSLESMGKAIPALLHMRSPFDPKNLRIKGIYDDCGH